MSRWKMNGRFTGTDKRENRKLADKLSATNLTRTDLDRTRNYVMSWAVASTDRHCLAMDRVKTLSLNLPPPAQPALTTHTPPGHFAINQHSAVLQAPVVCFRGLCCKQHDVSTVGVCPSSGPRSESGYARDKQSRTLSSPPRVQTVVGGKI